MKPKIYLTILGIFLIPALSLNAQDFKVGALAGFDVTNARMTDLPDGGGFSGFYDPMISFNINGYVGYKSSGFMGLSLEPGFIQKGGREKYEGDYMRFQLNYLQMPVLADFYLTDKLFISIGPEVGYMINAKAKFKASSNDISEMYDNKFELSGLLGFNYTIIKNFDIGIRYNHGITYTTKISINDVNGNFIGSTRVYNQYFQLVVRFKI
jgi:hypothetical protein